MQKFDNDLTTLADDIAYVLQYIAPFVLAGLGIFMITNVHKIADDLQSNAITGIVSISSASVARGSDKKK